RTPHVTQRPPCGDRSRRALQGCRSPDPSPESEPKTWAVGSSFPDRSYVTERASGTSSSAACRHYVLPSPPTVQESMLKTRSLIAPALAAPAPPAAGRGRRPKESPA